MKAHMMDVTIVPDVEVLLPDARVTRIPQPILYGKYPDMGKVVRARVYR
jgi:hypothetical protein